ncbi:hypothetical protein ACFQUX_23820 [Pantoea stewartii]
MNTPPADKVSAVRLHQVMGIIIRDKIFVAGLLCSTLCSIVFIHFEAVLPQYLLLLNSDAAVKLVTLILVTNASTVLVFQTFLVRIMARMHLPQRILLGAVIFFFSQLCFSPCEQRIVGFGCLSPCCLVQAKRF